MPRRWFVLVGGMAVVALFVGSSGDTLGHAQAQTTVAMTPWGEPDLQGVWTDPYATNLQRPPSVGEREFYSEEEVAELDRLRIESDVRPRAEQGSVADVAGAYDGVYVSVRPTGRRTSRIVDPPNGRLPPLTPEVQQRREAMREYALALKQNTVTCQNREGDCANGTYGPPSPRRAEMPPSYSTRNLNRANGPEDRSSGERCMATRLPVFNGYWRVVQSPGVVSIYYDVGQGQGFQRVIPVTDRPHLPPRMSASPLATRAAGGKARRWSSMSPISNRISIFRVPARTCISSSAGRRGTPTPSSTRSRSRIRPRGHAPGPRGRSWNDRTVD